MSNVKELIANGGAVLGIEFGSTNIKAVLIDDQHNPVASGSHGWENRLENGFWTYSLEDITTGLRSCYKDLKENVKKEYGVTITNLKALGFSAMMHGYMAFDKEGNLLVPFRTWRNGTTGPAARALTELFNYNIPERWSISHLYQAILNGEEHVPSIDYITTLAGYIHRCMTGKKVLGIGDASGMFPIDISTKEYDLNMIGRFDELVADKKYPWKLTDILPEILFAGDDAGILTEEGAKLLDEEGDLKAGIPLCPPEGDAGTGMTATNSVSVRTGNVSAGTSIFAMVVLEKDLNKVHPEIDLVTTPDGSLVGMVHANNCTSDINAWVKLFMEFAAVNGCEIDKNKVYVNLFNKALEGETDCGGILSYGFLSGENIMGVSEGRPFIARTPDSRFNIANFMRSHIYTAMSTLKVGMDILVKEEKVAIDKMLGHGGLFKTPVVGQKFMAAAIGAPVSLMTTAGEGGPWGMAVLAAYMAGRSEGETLGEYLDNKVFAGAECTTLAPEKEDMEGFDRYIEIFKNGIGIEKAAIGAMPL
ncbi:MAG: FGGY-family carbohydrate kinase [Parasporobacterium sp.]|nr:FGGY-family carbohydrate kinase [Parasporobacterium sp.]